MRTFARYDPVTVLVYFAAVVGISVFCFEPMLLLTSLASCVVYNLMMCGAGRSHIYYALIFAATLVVNPLVSHDGVTVLLVLNDRPITLEATVYGLFAAAMICSTLYAFGSFTHIMTSDKLLYLLGILSPKLSLVISMGLRLIPEFSRDIKRISEAQTTLGIYADGNPIDAIKGKLRIFSVMVSLTLENGITTAQSMEARGWGVGKRTNYSQYHIKKADVILIVAMSALSAITCICVASGAMNTEFYPSFKTSPMSCAKLVGRLSFALLAALPILNDIVYAIRKKFSSQGRGGNKCLP